MAPNRIEQSNGPELVKPIGVGRHHPYPQLHPREVVIAAHPVRRNLFGSPQRGEISKLLIKENKQQYLSLMERYTIEKPMENDQVSDSCEKEKMDKSEKAGKEKVPAWLTVELKAYEQQQQKRRRSPSESETTPTHYKQKCITDYLPKCKSIPPP